MAWQEENEVRFKDWLSEQNRKTREEAFKRDPFNERLKHLQNIIINRIGDEIQCEVYDAIKHKLVRGNALRPDEIAHMRKIDAAREAQDKLLVDEYDAAKDALIKLFKESDGDEAKIHEGYEALTHHYYNKDY